MKKGKWGASLKRTAKLAGIAQKAWKLRNAEGENQDKPSPPDSQMREGFQ